MSTLAKLREATSLHDLAAILGYQPKALSFLLYKIPDARKYREFEVDKKSGGVRVINAPVARIKTLQQHLSTALYQCRAEIEASAPKGREPLSHGYRQGQSIITNARPHIKRRYVLNLDLEDFFPSCNFGRVRGFFLKNNDFQLHKDVATIIAQISCHANQLPQGAPSSPIISDMLAQIMDVRLAQLAKKHSCTYSRYVDDLTFSTNLKLFPPAIAYQSPIAASNWLIDLSLLQKIENAGFTVNPAKTRMHLKSSRQVVTGLTVNRKVNVQATYYRRLRSMSHSLFRTGTYSCEGETPTTSPNKIGGMLNYVFYIKHHVAHAREVDVEEEKKDTGVRRLFRDFLFFKHFVMLEQPLIVCEGKTDNAYLRIAIQRLGTLYPQLTSITPSGFKSRIGYFKHSDIANEVLKLGGGIGGIKILAIDYLRRMKHFVHRPLKHPVILLIDNDVPKILESISNECKITVSLKTHAPFYHIGMNLYLVKTPEAASASSFSCIEDLFQPSVRLTVVNGKTFKAKASDPLLHYGKVELIEKVIHPNAAAIDFSGFVPLLDRITAVMDHYHAP